MYMRFVRVGLRFVLALAVFVLLIVPTIGAFSPPDPFTQLYLTAPFVVFVAVPLAGLFVRRSHSLRRLVTYYLVVNVLVILIGLVIVGFKAVVQPPFGQSGIIRTLTNATISIGAYVFAFHLVYRGGYARLKAQLT
jgi:uncharacterized membrane protein YhaH (DUF805 family)